MADKRKRVDPNIPNEAGDTALSKAAKAQDVPMLELLLADDRTTCARPFFSPSNQAYDVATISGPRAFRSSARSDGDASDGDASDARDGDASDVDARARRARAALTRSFTTPRRAGAPVRGEEHGSGAFFRSPW